MLKRFILASLGGLVVTAASCNPLGSDSESFLIPVTKITAPERMSADETLTASFSGAIGPNQCWQLDRVERTRGVREMEIRFVGVRDTGGSCLQMPSELQHVETVMPPFEETFTIRVLQPSGPPVEHLVQVE